VARWSWRQDPIREGSTSAGKGAASLSLKSGMNPIEEPTLSSGGWNLKKLLKSDALHLISTHFA
jgi:hypothetical protein